jgi:hypothetical protein
MQGIYDYRALKERKITGKCHSDIPCFYQWPEKLCVFEDYCLAKSALDKCEQVSQEDTNV